MSEISKVSPFVPIIPILGNHETFDKNNVEIFRLSFECYNLTSAERVQGYNFGNFHLITFDPFL